MINGKNFLISQLKMILEHMIFQIFQQIKEMIKQQVVC